MTRIPRFIGSHNSLDSRCRATADFWIAAPLKCGATNDILRCETQRSGFDIEDSLPPLGIDILLRCADRLRVGRGANIEWICKLPAEYIDIADGAEVTG